MRFVSFRIVSHRFVFSFLPPVVRTQPTHERMNDDHHHYQSISFLFVTFWIVSVHLDSSSIWLLLLLLLMTMTMPPLRLTLEAVWNLSLHPVVPCGYSDLRQSHRRHSLLYPLHPRLIYALSRQLICNEIQKTTMWRQEKDRICKCNRDMLCVIVFACPS